MRDRASDLRAIADGRLMLNVRNGVTVARSMLARIADEFEAMSTALAAKDAELAEVRQQYVDANEARIDAEAELAKVTDPNAVHVNMLRGVIAKPSVAQIQHVYQGEIVNDEEVDALRARVAELEGALRWVSDWINYELPVPTRNATTALGVVLDTLAGRDNAALKEKNDAEQG